MLLKYMTYFIAVVDAGSFTKAAQECYISQSAISQQIKALEKELGVDLIKREHRGFQLTVAGEYFYRHGKGLLEEIRQLKEETVRRGSEEELSLKIGYLKCYGAMELHHAVTEFSLTYPEVSMSIVNGTHEELYEYLKSGQADLILSDQRRAFSDAYYNYELLYSDTYVEIAQQDPLSQKETISLEELKRKSCILITSREQQLNEMEYYQNTLGYASQFLYEDSLEEGRLMVAGNRGFLPVEAVGTLPPPAKGIQRIPLYHRGKPFQRNYCAFWLKEHTNYYIEEFAELLRHLLKDS